MDVFLAVLGATGVMVAMAANVTSIARYVGERRKAAASAAAKRGETPASGGTVAGATADPPPAAPAAGGPASARVAAATSPGRDPAARSDGAVAEAGVEPSTLPPAPQPSTALPMPMTSFEGRSELMEELAALLLRPDVRLVTLYGPGGAGKSRVAIELAARLRRAFADDVIYVSLAAVRDPELVASSLAIGLGVREDVGVSSVRAMQAALARRRGLLVIDNFEHLVEAAPVIGQLAQAAPRLTILVTSRSLLRLTGEVAFPVPPLTLPPTGDLDPERLLASGAVRLFVERARAVDPRFELDADNATAVVEICRRVDALPLAVELAAARVRSLPPQALLARMGRRLPLLSDGPRDAPQRQRTLRDTIDWSVALLDAGEQTLFGRLSLFDGGASLRLIEQVLGDGTDLLDDLTSLVDKSLVQRQGDEDDDRVAMLETVREYASEWFASDPEADALRAKHALAYLELAERGAQALKGSDQAQWGVWLVHDLGNLREAMATLLATGAAAEALRLATALRPLFMARCHYEEGRRLLRLALDGGHHVRGGVRAAALLALGALAWREGDLAASLPALEESLTTYREAGDAAGEAASLRMLGIHAHNAGDYDLARARLREALTLMRRNGDEEGVGNTLLSLGNVAFDQAEPTAQGLYEQSRAAAERIGDTLGTAYALDNLGVLAWCQGELATAARHADAASELYDRLGHRFGIASVLHRRGLLALARHDVDVAQAALDRSLRHRMEIGDTRGAAFVRYDLARLALADGRPGDAADHLRRGLEQAERHGAPLVEVLYLEGVAALQAVTGEPTTALELLSAATAWRERAGVPICPVNGEQHARLWRDLRERIDAAAWTVFEARGAGRSVAEAVTLAQALLNPAPGLTPSGRAAGSARGRAAPRSG